MAVAIVLSAGWTGAAEAPSQAKQMQVLQAINPSMVQVEYHLQPHEGDSPTGTLPLEQCPHCGSFHVDQLADAFQEERPMISPGYLISPTQVVAMDPQTHPRFIREVIVRYQNQKAVARILAHPRMQQGLILELDKPMEGVRPLTFVSQETDPTFTVSYKLDNGIWNLQASPFSTLLKMTGDGAFSRAVPGPCLMTSGSGEVQGICMGTKLSLSNAWKGSPLQWPMAKAADMQKRTDEMIVQLNHTLPRVKLMLRNPKNAGRTESRVSRYGPKDDEDSTEINTTGLLLENNRIMILSHLKARTTARIESIRVILDNKEEVPARFEGSFKDYGCLLAKLEKPSTSVVHFATNNIHELRDQILIMAQVKNQGENRTVHSMPGRITQFAIGPKGISYPNLRQDEIGLFVYDWEGRLVAVPVRKRSAPKSEGDNSYESQNVLEVPVTVLAELVAGGASSFDPANVPLSEADANRVGWLGVELQPMDQELARANNVADQTSDGENGAMVTCVYPGSPAAEAGIDVGAILLRIQSEKAPNPIEIHIQEDYRRAQMNNFWEQLDRIPAQAFDQIPTPWPQVDTPFNQMLTELGVGAKTTLEYLVDGKLIKKQFTVAASPTHYGSAPRYKSEKYGITVRDQTYETRRFLQKQESDPGVIISRVEMGGKAAVAGLKPFELITHINEQPLMNVKDFEKQMSLEGELRLSVKRLSKGRLVTINANVAAPAMK